MIQIQTTKDIMFLVIAFCILLFTVFFAWLLYYFIAIIGDVRKITKSVEEKVEKVGKIIDMVKEKLDSSTTQFALLVGAVKEIIKIVIEKRAVKKETKKKK
ncbi:MAG: hypothetical protein V1891_00035 [bacterium]